MIHFRTGSDCHIVPSLICLSRSMLRSSIYGWVANQKRFSSNIAPAIHNKIQFYTFWRSTAFLREFTFACSKNAILRQQEKWVVSMLRVFASACVRHPGDCSNPLTRKLTQSRECIDSLHVSMKRISVLHSLLSSTPSMSSINFFMVQIEEKSQINSPTDMGSVQPPQQQQRPKNSI